MLGQCAVTFLYSCGHPVQLSANHSEGDNVGCIWIIELLNSILNCVSATFEVFGHPPVRQVEVLGQNEPYSMPIRSRSVNSAAISQPVWLDTYELSHNPDKILNV